MRNVLMSFAAMILLAGASAAFADTYATGSLDGQNGWNGGASGGFTNNAAGDEAVTTAAAHSGTQSWRLSAGYDSPGAGTPFSPQLTASAGLTSSGATADSMSISIWFKPVGALGDGTSQSIYEGTTNRDDRTGSNLYLDNTASGIVLSTYEFGGGTYPLITLATLNDTNWHNVVMTTTSIGNDPATETTTFSIDGGAAITTTPWADQYRQANTYPYPSASSVKFDSGSATALSTTGFYYDDLSYSVFNSNDPSTVLASYSTSFEGASAVPLPSSAWAGIVLLCGLSLTGGMKRLRRVEA
ncbi:MAG TPA: hypothetical protein VFE58_05620 [Tepidisphaeraceae bacterium]|jgi:hypothetical protein|nr:hypothetical protein [Tepidisphaeraceae bacterium]